MTVNADRVAILLDQGDAPKMLALLDRASGAWTNIPITAANHTLPYMTDVALLHDGLVALMAPANPPPAPSGPLDCVVVTGLGPGREPGAAPLSDAGPIRAPLRRHSRTRCFLSRRRHGRRHAGTAATAAIAHCPLSAKRSSRVICRAQ